MRKIALIAIIIAFYLSACTPTTRIPSGATGLAALPIVSGTAQYSPDYIEARQGDLWVRVLTPREGEILPQNAVDITGQAAPGALLDINGNQLLVPPDQFFRLTLPLTPGQNTIQIRASDANASQVTITLTVTHQP